VVANIFALFFTTEPDSCPIRWCKKKSTKSPRFTHSSRASQTDRQTDRRKRDPNSGAFTAYRSL